MPGFGGSFGRVFSSLVIYFSIFLKHPSLHGCWVLIGIMSMGYVFSCCYSIVWVSDGSVNGCWSL